MPVGKRKRKRARRRTKRELDFLFKADVLRRFVEAHGWDAVVRDVRPSDVNLYTFVQTYRRAFAADRISDLATETLEAISGWSWDPRRDRHRAMVDKLRCEVRAHGWQRLGCPGDRDDQQLRDWCANRRAEKRRGTLARWLQSALEAIPGWSWAPRDDQYGVWIDALRAHVRRHGWTGLQQGTRDRSGLSLGDWLYWIRYQYRRDKLPDWVVLEMDRIRGWTWEPRQDYQQRMLARLRKFVERHGWAKLTKARVAGAVELGAWVGRCRRRGLAGELDPELRDALEAISGWSWTPRDDAYEVWLRSLRAHVARHGWAAVVKETRDASGARLGDWVARVRKARLEGTLPAWVIRELDGMTGWRWRPCDDQHRHKLELLRRFIARKGWDAFTMKLMLDGEHIGGWVNRCLTAQRKGALPTWLAKELVTIPGWRWRGAVRPRRHA